MVVLTRLLQKNKLTLITSLPANQFELYQAAVDAGTDAVKIHVNIEHRASGNTFGTLQENIEFVSRIAENRSIPVGVVPGDAVDKVKQEEIDEFVKLNLDFISLYSDHAPAWLLADRRVTKMIAVNGQQSAAETACLLGLGIDVLEASIMSPEMYGAPLSLKDLARYKRLADLSAIPVVVPTQKRIDVSDLPGLLQTGVKGLMVGAVVTGMEPKSMFESVRRFRKEIDRLTNP